MKQRIEDQRAITACAVDIIKAINARRGKPLQPRDRMALKLLTPKNSALILKDRERNLGCRQIHFDLYTEDLGWGAHRLIPTGVHVFNAEKGWWSDEYGLGRFLWNLYLNEEPQEGMARILERLFRFKLAGIRGPTARIRIQGDQKTMAAEVADGLNLYIRRDKGSVETTLKRMIAAEAVYSPKEIGLYPADKDRGRIVLLFGKRKRFGVSFTIEKL